MAVLRKPQRNHTFRPLSSAALSFAHSQQLLKVDCGHTVVCQAHRKAIALLMQGDAPSDDRPTDSLQPHSPALDDPAPQPAPPSQPIVPFLSPERQAVWASLASASAASSSAIALHRSASCVSRGDVQRCAGSKVKRRSSVRRHPHSGSSMRRRRILSTVEHTSSVSNLSNIGRRRVVRLLGPV